MSKFTTGILSTAFLLILFLPFKVIAEFQHNLVFDRPTVRLEEPRELEVKLNVSPSSVTTDAASVETGGFHSCLLNNANEVKCWGDNEFGQLGDSTNISRTIPVLVNGLNENITSIALGRYHTCVLTASSGVKCWGNNESGQLGNGTKNNQSSPVDVTGLTTDVTAIAAGAYHSCAITNNGGMKCWGRNSNGQLGDGTIVDRTTPVDVSGLSNNIASIDMSWVHSCALTNSGDVKCWGRNNYGQLGDGTMTDRTTPIDVAGLGGSATSVAVNGDALSGHTCATVSGGVKCWGMNLTGQLGDGTTTNSTSPRNVTGVSESKASAGYYYSCTLLSDDTVKCWGSNYFGQLGDGTKTDRLTAVSVSGLSNITEVSAGGYHACALDNAGNVYCWGQNKSGQLGNASTTDSTMAVKVFQPTDFLYLPAILNN